VVRTTSSDVDYSSCSIVSGKENLDSCVTLWPAFNEGRYGYRAFGELLQDAEKHGLVVLREDSRSGTYVVSGFGKSK